MIKINKRRIKFYFINIFILIYLLIFFFIKNNYVYFLCKECIKEKNKHQKCLSCETNKIFKSLKHISIDETLNQILNYNKSIVRFGDGEFDIIFGFDIEFQKFNKKLKEKLLKVLNSNIPNLIVGIPPFYNNKNPYWVNWINQFKFKLVNIINFHKKYYNSFITNLNSLNSNRTLIENYIKRFKQIWNNRNILTIEGNKTRLGFKNNLFNNARTINRIICPAKNAFDVYEKIVQYITNLSIDKDTLILISLGPTATILAYEIIKSGIKNQIIDFGHFDMRYELFLRNDTNKILITNKNTNEILERKKKIILDYELKYLNQIICKIN